MVFLKKHKEIFLLILFFWMIYSFISVIKHIHYQTFTWDTGFFDQLLWKLSQFKEPISSFSNLHVFGDHFQFILLLFVPLYWLPQSLNLLFIAHAFIAVLSSLPVYLISLKVNKSKIFALSVSFSMLIFTGMQFAVLDGFHQSVTSSFFYALAIYGLVSHKSKLYWFSIIVLLLTKEEMALLSVSIGAIALISGHKAKGIITVVISSITFFFAIYYFLPRIQGEYVHLNYGVLGYTPLEVVENILSNPFLFLKLLFSPGVKLKTIFESFFSFGFLPILSPIYLISATQQFVVRFLDTITIHRWTNLNHYAFPLASIFAIASIFTAELLTKIFKKVKNIYLILAIYLVFFALMQDYLLHGPINSLFKKDFYVKKQWMRDNDKMLKLIPKNASVAATNNLGPHFSQRDRFYLMPELHDADFLIFDLQNGPNKYSPASYEKTLEIYNEKVLSGAYISHAQSGRTKILKKE